MRLRRRTAVQIIKIALLAFALFFLVVEPLVLAGEGGVLSEFRTLLEVIALLKTQYVDPVSAIDLAAEYVRQGSINGMLAHGLDDPYTRHLDKAAYEQMRVDTTGVFSGIGIVVGMKDDRLTIVSPIMGTPGAAAGLRGGDRIIAIDGQETTYMSLNEAVMLMRGPKGTVVELLIERGPEDDPQRLEVRVVRDDIEVPTVERVQIIEPDPAIGLRYPVGYIQLTSFNEKTSRQLARALQDLQAQGAEGLILDMRNNPGGLLNAAIEVSNRFLNGGPILHVVGRDQQRRTLAATPGTDFSNKPMVLLVNEFSASASEIVAGALRDRGVARIVGTTTFGKGLVQTVVPLRDGSALSLTTARYQTAGGHDIHGKGIVPDVVVELSEDEIEKLYERMQQEKVDLGDPQLLRAVQVLQEWIDSTKLALAG